MEYKSFVFDISHILITETSNFSSFDIKKLHSLSSDDAI
jgi:hypothetical protein